MGAFSNVYKGKLQDGRPVAVKCLKGVKGGTTGFWAEVTTIARMHHLNLVKLWGFCNEKILVYWHVPNGPLENYLFNQGDPGLDDINNGNAIDPMTGFEQKPKLDWNVRYRIALGIARAIAYLHEECLEWVLHCDIKPANILLGDDFCPKVADFGLSKLRNKEQKVDTSGIHGTPGYLALEWIEKGSKLQRSTCLVMGCIARNSKQGKENGASTSSMETHDWYLPRWAFKLTIEERKMEEILDCHVKHSYDSNMHFSMVKRMVRTAFWCIQEKPEMRPSMGKVVKMLEGTVEIIEPPKPTIFFIVDSQ